jgi:small neutral amino acid transporter SnatA (MarC family)
MDRLALVSMICGVLSFVFPLGFPFVFGPLAIITGFLGLKTKDKKSKQYCKIGIILGVVSLLITAILLNVLTA